MSLAPNPPAQPPPGPERPYVVSLKLGFNNSGAVDVAKQLRSKVGINGDKPGQLDNGKVDLYVIGQGALGAAAPEKTRHDIGEAEQWGLPIILIVLLAVFGSLAAAAMPLILGVLTVVVSMGVVFLLSMFTTMSVFVTPTVSMFGIALAVDYSLFILMRYREELRAGRDAKQATDAAMATSGLAVVLSGLTVIASLAGIYLINTPVLRSMATGAVVTVAVAVLTSVTLIPAILATFGRAAAKRSWLLHWSHRPESTQSPFWTRWIGWVMRRPWASALGASVLLLTLAAPALSMTLSNSMQRQFGPEHEMRGGVNAATRALGPGALGPVRVLVTFPDGNATDPSNMQVADAVGVRMREAPNIVTVQPPALADDDHSALLSAVLAVDPEDMAARDTIDWMRERLPQVPGAEDARIDVGGPTALIKDFDDRVEQTQPWVFLFVSAIAFVMLLISIRSVFLALKGVLMTVLSVAAAYGSIVMVFQWGWLKDLGFQPISSLDSSVPPLVLAITFGLSMDYEIFLLTRIRERFLQTNNTRDAVAWGVSTSARTITSAALIMIAVYIGFAFAGMPLVAEIGVACAVAIAVDATVVRLVLVPALMAMFDQWNWWLPRWLDRISAVGRLRTAAAQGRHRRRRRHPGRHFVAGGAQLRHADGGQVGSQAQRPCARRDLRGRPVGVQWLRPTGRRTVGSRARGGEERPHRRHDRSAPEFIGARCSDVAPPQQPQEDAVGRSRRTPGHDVAGQAFRGTRRVEGRLTDRCPRRTAQPGGNHQRPVADG